MTADRPLAEIVAEGRAMCRPDWQGPKGYVATFRAEHFARLLAVAEAAVEAERLATIVQRHYITAPPDADSTAWTQRAWNAAGEADEAIERLFAAVRGAAGENGGK